MSKYFTYDDEYISGWQYFFRTFLNSFLAIIIVGLYLQSVTAYKRARSLGNSSTACNLFGIWGFVSIIIAIVPGGVFINIIPHWYLWFPNGNPNKVVDSNNDTIINESNEADDVN